MAAAMMHASIRNAAARSPRSAMVSAIGTPSGVRTSRRAATSAFLASELTGAPSERARSFHPSAGLVTGELEPLAPAADPAEVEDPERRAATGHGVAHRYAVHGLPEDALDQPGDEEETDRADDDDRRAPPARRQVAQAGHPAREHQRLRQHQA